VPPGRTGHFIIERALKAAQRPQLNGRKDANTLASHLRVERGHNGIETDNLIEMKWSFFTRPAKAARRQS
jgi:hypothetical protein